MTALRVAVFGNGAYASTLLRALRDEQHDVVLLCTRAETPAFRRGRAVLARPVRRYVRDDFLYRRPLAQIPPPATLIEPQTAVYASAALGTQRFMEALRSARPDLLLVAGFHRLVPAAVLAVPTMGAVNFHPALLPRHRGGTPNRWVVLHGEAESGMTAHFMTPRFDDGDILAQMRVPVSPDQTWGEVEEAVFGTLPGVARQVLGDATRDALGGTPQDERHATIEPSLRPEQAVIDWRQSAERAHRLALALRPLSGARFLTGSRRVCLWESEVMQGGKAAPPGTVLGWDRGDLLVACGQDVLRVRTLLRRGKVRPARDVLGRLLPGTVLVTPQQ